MSAHTPVLLHEAINALLIDANGLYVDGTFGRGGHTKELLSHLSGKGRIIGFDKDPVAIDLGKVVFKFEKRLELIHESFSKLHLVLKKRGNLGDVSGVLLDLGVSSPQLDQGDRGFSFLHDGPLDMRMNTSKGMTAAQWIAESDQDELIKIFKTYGEEKFAVRIAKNIIQKRFQEPIETTHQLAAIVSEAHPRWKRGQHPATKIFQAIRIHINNELEDLDVLLRNVLKILKVGGKLVVISFHSLEDRKVKQFIREKEKGPVLPKGIPIRNAEHKILLRSVGKSIKPSGFNIEENKRSRSAIMRVAERVA